jgi:hypothetical protein
MALTPTEEAQVLALVAQEAALLSLAAEEPAIISNLGATDVSLSDLTAATTPADADLLLIRQGTTDKSVAGSVLKTFVQPAAASTTVSGIVELATDAETNTGTDTARAITPSNLSARTATTTRTGVVELATDAEAVTGTDTARAVTPAGVAAAFADRLPKGVYTPTMVAGTNTFSVSTAGFQFIYTEVDGNLIISGHFTLDPGATGTTIAYAPLPPGYSSAFVGTDNCSGVMAESGGQSGVVLADTANDRLQFTYNATVITPVDFRFFCQLQILP